MSDGAYSVAILVGGVADGSEITVGPAQQSYALTQVVSAEPLHTIAYYYERRYQERKRGVWMTFRNSTDPGTVHRKSYRDRDGKLRFDLVETKHDQATDL